MSFISIIARENFLTVMSEGRVSREGKPTGEEDFKKFFRVSPHFIVGFGGADRALILNFLGETGLLEPNNGDFQAVADHVQAKLREKPYRHGKVFVGFGGVNSNGQIEFYALGTGNTETRHFLPKGDDISFCFFSLDGYEMDLQSELIKFLGITNYRTPAQTLRAQKLLNDAFAKINPSMNTNTFQAVINKDTLF